MTVKLFICNLQEVYLRRGKILFQSCKTKAVESLVVGWLTKTIAAVKVLL